MQVNRDGETTKGSSETFTGDVYMDSIVRPADGKRLSVNNVHFTPGARTAWHTHPNGQVLYVTTGVGRAQRSGGPIEEIKVGDRVMIEPGEDHWHGAAPNRSMTHLSLVEVDDSGATALWGRKVTDEEYGAG